MLYILICRTRGRCNTSITRCRVHARNLLPFYGDGRTGKLSTRVFSSCKCYQIERRLLGGNLEFSWIAERDLLSLKYLPSLVPMSKFEMRIRHALFPQA